MISVVVREERIWKPGRVIEKHGKLRSYIVQTDTSEIRRNRKDLRSSRNRPPLLNMDHDNLSPPAISHLPNNSNNTDIAVSNHDESDVSLETPDTIMTRPKRTIKTAN